MIKEAQFVVFGELQMFRILPVFLPDRNVGSSGQLRSSRWRGKTFHSEQFWQSESLIDLDKCGSDLWVEIACCQKDDFPGHSCSWGLWVLNRTHIFVLIRICQFLQLKQFQYQFKWFQTVLHLVELIMISPPKVWAKQSAADIVKVTNMGEDWRDGRWLYLLLTFAHENSNFVCLFRLRTSLIVVFYLCSILFFTLALS